MLKLWFTHCGGYAKWVLVIQCDTLEMQSRLMWERPWAITRMVLQLTPWRENFQPTFEKLDIAVLWMQFHYLPIELWDGDLLEHIASHFSKLLKVDDFTMNMSRVKYARICVEIDLLKPMRRGF